MFSTSKDVLFIVISVCVPIVTVFLCLFLFNAFRVLRKLNRIVDYLKIKTEKVTEAFSESLGNIGLLVELVKMGFEYFANHKKTKKKTK
jgi:uncharacterized membrane protein